MTQTTMQLQLDPVAWIMKIIINDVDISHYIQEIQVDSKVGDNKSVVMKCYYSTVIRYQRILDWFADSGLDYGITEKTKKQTTMVFKADYEIVLHIINIIDNDDEKYNDFRPIPAMEKIDGTEDEQ